jgi:hypothetical protein
VAIFLQAERDAVAYPTSESFLGGDYATPQTVEYARPSEAQRAMEAPTRALLAWLASLRILQQATATLVVNTPISHLCPRM